MTNLETDDAKLLQVVLIGQPELQQLAPSASAASVGSAYHGTLSLLPPLSEDVDAYVRFRLQVAGCVQPIFTSGAIRALHRLSRGIPRIINLICERHGLVPLPKENRKIGEKLLIQAVFDASGIRDRNHGKWGAVAFALCGLSDGAGRLAA